MGCGASAQYEKNQLENNKTLLLERRREISDRDHQIQEAEVLVRSVGLRSQEAREREMLQLELASVESECNHNLSLCAIQHCATHELGVHACREETSEKRELMLEEGISHFHISLIQGTLNFEEEAFCNHFEAREALQCRLIEEQECRAQHAYEELLVIRAEHKSFTAERDRELEAASVAKEAFAVEKRAAQWHDECKMAEVRKEVSESEALEDTHSGLHSKTRSLQHELSKVLYTIGQRDHELSTKDAELQEVRDSLASIQSELDEVNAQLNNQCGRVHKVEGSLRAAHELNKHVHVLRDMLQESHGALKRLCNLLEQERLQQDRSAQSLKTQQVRTELLLQLLHYFKSRTQDTFP